MGQFVFPWTLYQGFRVGTKHFHKPFPGCLLRQDLQHRGFSVYREACQIWIRFLAFQLLNRLNSRRRIVGNGSHSHTTVLKLLLNTIGLVAKHATQPNNHFVSVGNGDYIVVFGRIVKKGHTGRHAMGLVGGELDTGKAIGVFSFEKGGGGVPPAKGLVAQNVNDETSIVLNAGSHHIFFHGGREFLNDAPPAIGMVGNHLGQHGIVMGCHHVSLGHTRIDAQPRFHGLGFSVRSQRTGRGQKASQRIFGVQTCFHGVTPIRKIGFGRAVVLFPFLQNFVGQTPSSTRPQHALYQINTTTTLSRDHFRHGMFHLKTGVHFQKVKVLFLIDQPFHGTGRCVSDPSDQTLDLFHHGQTGRFVQEG